MSLAFRNVDVDPASGVETWPFEAVLTALERGGLHYWRRLALAIADDPWGPLTRKVEQALAAAEPYGVTTLMTAVIDHARAAAQASERRAVAGLIAEAIGRSGLSRTDFATRIGTSASRLSTYESGKVVPSATLLLRMTRLADRAATTNPPPDVA